MNLGVWKFRVNKVTDLNILSCWVEIWHATVLKFYRDQLALLKKAMLSLNLLI